MGVDALRRRSRAVQPGEVLSGQSQRRIEEGMTDDPNPYDDEYDDEDLCPLCDGSGVLGDGDCPNCDGTGFVQI